MSVTCNGQRDSVWFSVHPVLLVVVVASVDGIVVFWSLLSVGYKARENAQTAVYVSDRTTRFIKDSNIRHLGKLKVSGLA